MSSNLIGTCPRNPPRRRPRTLSTLHTTFWEGPLEDELAGLGEGGCPFSSSPC